MHISAIRARFVRALAIVVLAAAGLIGYSAADAAAVTPAFVQQVSAHQVNKTSVAVTPTTALGAGNRLLVEVGVWSSGQATASTVTDAAGDTFTRLLHFSATDHTEMSVWTAPVTGGAGARPAITVTPTAVADVGVVATEYSGISAVAGSGAVDQTAQATGRTTAAATVSSTATAAARNDNEIAVGFYTDSGFGDTLSAGTGFTSRANVSPANDMELLVEDRAVSTGATPAATFGTGANTSWLAAVVVFQSASLTAPSAATNVTATAGDGSAGLTWVAPPSGGSAITKYAITPYIGTSAQTPINIAGSPPATSATVTGLTNNTSYTFTVTATNTIGTGPESDPSNTVTPSPNPGGTWSALQTWPIMTVATHLLHNGQVVAWDGWQQPQPTVYGDPTNPATLSTVNAPDSIFCDGAADLPDGRLLVIGGYGGLSTGQIGIVDTNIFDPATDTWTRVANMHNPRWYPTVTELSDGRYVAISGNSTDASTWADTPEVYDPKTNTWTLLSNVNTSQVHEVEYPFSYEVPNGNVFVIGPEEDNSHLLDVDQQTWTSTGSAGFFNGSSVMYRPGKILYSGGADLINTPSPAHTNTAVIDLNAQTPAWRTTAPMANARIYHNLTMLADGTVLAVGGSNTSNQQEITTGMLPTEIWHPDTETWTTAAPIAAARNYHSTSVLLPDGRVLVSGGGHSEGMQDAAQYSSQIYSPSYLSQGPRPVISSAPATATYGSNFTVSTPDAAGITGVNLVSLGADTHQIDMNQHFVPLNFTAGSGTLNVTSPSSGTVAPPGYYMMFILKNGVPSVSTMIRIGPSQVQTAPGVPTNVSATAGNASADVRWTAPADGNSPITSYTVTPYRNGTAQSPKTVTGNPPATAATVTGLTNGSSYTFTVAATNGVGSSVESAQSNAVTPSTTPAPAFLQQAGTHANHVGSLGVAPTSPIGSGHRMVVEVGVWNSAGATASGVTDSAGNTYTKLTNFAASDGTEMSLWTAPVTNGAGTQPTITATSTSAADIGVTAMEYSGLSTAAGSAALDTISHATGKTSGAANVASGPTAATTGSSELAIGFYADSGFGSSPTAATGWTARAKVAPNGEMDLATEDQSAAAGTTPNATFGTSANTVWLAATAVFKTGVAAPPTVPGTPANVTASPTNGGASVSWTAPSNGGSPLTSYTVTPYLGSTAQPTKTVTGAPPATTTAMTGLQNGSAYTFKVSATNAIGTGPPSSASNSVEPTAVVAPAFVSQASAQVVNKTSIAVTPPANLGSGDRMIVETGVWSSAHPTASSVTDSAGDTFTKLLSFAASDGTEMSIWSAPVTAGAGTRPTITATATGNADIGIVALDYAGLAASTPVDVSAHATGTTTTARAVGSGSTAATTGANALAIGFYADSGFNTALSADPGYAQRANLSPNGQMDQLAEDLPVTAGATPAATIGTGASTVWLAATVVFNAP